MFLCEVTVTEQKACLHKTVSDLTIIKGELFQKLKRSENISKMLVGIMYSS